MQVAKNESLLHQYDNSHTSDKDSSNKVREPCVTLVSRVRASGFTHSIGLICVPVVGREAHCKLVHLKGVFLFASLIFDWEFIFFWPQFCKYGQSECRFFFFLKPLWQFIAIVLLIQISLFMSIFTGGVMRSRFWNRETLYLWI